MNKKARQVGLSLSELMVALVLSTVLILAVTSVFLSSRQTSLVGNAFTGIQENARFATQVIGFDILNAGHMGCNSAQAATGSVVAAVGTDADNTRYVAAVSGWSAATKPAWLSPASPPKPGSDILKIQYASTNAFQLTNSMATAGSNLVVSGGSGALGMGPNVVADCSTAEVVSFTAVPALNGTTLTGTPAANLTKAYARNVTEVMTFVNHVYYLATDSVLRRYTSAGAIEDIADNVEDFGVLYGVDSNGDGTIDQYVATPGAMRVKSVQLCLLLTNTDTNLSIATPNYTDCHGNVKANAGRTFHQIYRTTAALRNGLP